MVAIDELRTELEAKFDINSVVEDITTRLDIDMRSMCQSGWNDKMLFDESRYFTGGFDITGQFMAKLGLIRTVQSPFNPGSYSYTEKGRDLYSQLKEEKYYEAKKE